MHACWRVLPVSLGLFMSGHAHGTIVLLTGDLGTVPFNGAPLCAVNTTSTNTFAHTVPGLGSISGDAIATNTGGTLFSLTVTNLSFNVTTLPVGGTFVKLTTTIVFVAASAAQTYAASHALTGSWSTALGNTVTGDALHDFAGANPSSVALPTLALTNALGAATFALGPTGASVTSSGTAYGVRVELQLFIDGAGFINLPGSYDTVAQVPAAGACALSGFGGLVTMRRRRA